MTDPIPTKPKRSMAKTGAIIAASFVGVIVVIGIVLYLIGYGAQIQRNQDAARIPDQVFVSRQVATVGSGTRPVSVVFIDDNTGDRVSGGVSGNTYNVVLPNGNHNWRVLVGWEGALGSNGSCAASGLSYSDTTANYRTINLRC